MPKRQPTLPKRQPIVVSGKFMPSADLARMLGISPSHAKWLDQMLEESRRQEALRPAKKRAANWPHRHGLVSQPKRHTWCVFETDYRRVLNP